MTEQRQEPCTTTCPAIQQQAEHCFYCHIGRRFVAPVEQRQYFGYDIIRDGKITQSGHNDTCILPAILRTRSHPLPPADAPNLHTCVHKEIRNGVEFCHYHDSEEHDTAIRAEAKREERERVLKIAQHLADTIPGFNRMDYMHFLKESLRRGEP